MTFVKIKLPDELAERIEKRLGKIPLAHGISEHVKKHGDSIGTTRKEIILFNQHIADIEAALGNISIGDAESLVKRVKDRCVLRLGGIDVELPDGWLVRVEEYAKRNNRSPEEAVQKAVRSIVAHLYGYF